jgi:hypothetical protein
VTLADKLLKTPVRERVIADCCVLIDEEVRTIGGFSGLAVKGAYKMVKAIKPRFVPEVVDGMLDEWVGKMEPYWVAFEKDGAGKTLAAFLAPKQSEIAESLLTVTDGRSTKTKHGTVKKMYDKLRPSAKNHVEHAIPGLAGLVEKHMKAPDEKKPDEKKPEEKK